MDESHAADIHFVYCNTEWQLVRELARCLHDRGYRVSPTRALGYPQAIELDVAPADAGAVIVVWPMRRELFEKPALEAREAAKRKHLVQIYAGSVRPDETYQSAPGIDFSRWEFKAAGSKWSALLHQLRALCGAPPKLIIDPNAAMPAIVLISTIAVALGAGGATLMQQKAPMIDAKSETAPLNNTQIALEGAKAALHVRPGATVGAGGPIRYSPDMHDDIAKDTGIDVEAHPKPNAHDAAPAQEPRSPQGPEY